MTNRRYLIFRVSIFINVAVLLYAAMHLSERSLELKYSTRDEFRNETYLSARGYEEFTSSKTPSTVVLVNGSTTSTMSVAEIEKRLSIVPSEVEATNDTVLEIVDEDDLSESTLQRLRVLLKCKDREFLPETVQRGEFWVLKNFVPADHGPVQCHETITYSTHAGYEFLDNVLPLVERWLSPVSLAIHAPGTDFKPTLDSIKYLRDCIGGELIRQYVTFHIFFSNKFIPSQIPSSEHFLQEPYTCPENPPYFNVTSTFKKEKDLLYPVNVARNIARAAALTHYVLPSDIELYPSRNLVPRFLNMIARNAKPLNTSTNPKVFPLSLFEVAADVQVPSTKTELQFMLAKKKAIPFHKFVCPMCHNIPKAKEWMKANETHQMEVFHVGKRSGQFKHWEPVYIGTHQDPYYDERLSWDGKMDKMTQGYTLCVRNYDFMILNNAFLVHKPGIKKHVKNPKRDKIAGRQTHYIKKFILPELEKLYGKRAGCIL